MGCEPSLAAVLDWSGEPSEEPLQTQRCLRERCTVAGQMGGEQRGWWGPFPSSLYYFVPMKLGKKTQFRTNVEDCSLSERLPGVRDLPLPQGPGSED